MREASRRPRACRNRCHAGTESRRRKLPLPRPPRRRRVASRGRRCAHPRSCPRSGSARPRPPPPCGRSGRGRAARSPRAARRLREAPGRPRCPPRGRSRSSRARRAGILRRAAAPADPPGGRGRGASIRALAAFGEERDLPGDQLVELGALETAEVAVENPRRPTAHRRCEPRPVPLGDLAGGQRSGNVRAQLRVVRGEEVFGRQHRPSLRGFHPSASSGTSPVSTSTPSSVTSTLSSIRIPPKSSSSSARSQSTAARWRSRNSGPWISAGTK